MKESVIINNYNLKKNTQFLLYPLLERKKKTRNIYIPKVDMKIGKKIMSSIIKHFFDF